MSRVFLRRTTAMWCSVYANLSCRMAFKEKQILTCFLLVWLGFIKVSGFVVFNEDKILNSEGSFNKNARTSESFGRGDEKPKSGEQVGRLLILQDPTSNSQGDGGLSSDLVSQGQPDESAYQSDDSGWMKLQPLWGQVYGLNTLYSQAVERFLGMKPTVDCVGEKMKLTVHGREARFGSNFLIDRGSIPPLPLSQLPSECGHRFMRTWRDFVFVIPYDGCYVSQERDTFVLPLLWWGLPVKLSCSSLASAQSLPTVSCYTNGMILRLHRGVTDNLKIKVKNEWQPLMNVSARCGYSLVSHPEGVVIHAPYMPCTEPTDGMFTLSMAMESEFNLSCPALSLNLPIKVPDLATEMDASTSIHRAPIASTPSPTTVATTTAAAATTTTTTTTTAAAAATTTTTAAAAATTTTTTTAAATTTSTTTTETARPIWTPHPYPIPAQSDFKPAPPIYPFLFFPPNIPSTVPQGPKIESRPAAITQGPQAPVYTKHPQIWYPWYHRPSVGFTPNPSLSTALPYPGKPLLPPTKAPGTPLLKPPSVPQDPIDPSVQLAPVFPPRNLVYPLYPGKPAPSSAKFPQVPHWPYPSQTQPRPSDPQAPLKPESAPPIPAPTRKPGPQLLLYPWYKPFPPRSSEIPPVTTKVPQNITASTSGPVTSSLTTYSSKTKETVKPQDSVIPYQSVVKGPPMSLVFDFTPTTNPSPPPPKLPEFVHSLAQIKPPMAPIGSAHAHSFHCKSFCPGPPSISYHNHHHFGHPLAISNFDISSLTKITGQMLSSVRSSGQTQFPFIQGMVYNYGPLSSNDPAVPPVAVQYLKHPTIKSTDAPDTSKHVPGPIMCPYMFRKLESTAASPVKPVIRSLGPSKPLSRPLQNGPVAEPIAYSDQSPNPVYQAEIQRYVPPWGDLMQSMFLVPNNVLPLEKTVQNDMSLKPTMPPAKNELMNYWYQATYSNARPPLSDSPAKYFNQMSLTQPFNNPSSLESSATPKHGHGKNPPMQQDFHPLAQIRNPVSVMNSQLYYPQNGETVVPVIRDSKLFDTYWVPAVQSNQNA